MIKENIIQSLQGTLNSSSILIIKMHLESIQDIDAKISELDAKIDDMLQNLHAEELRILLWHSWRWVKRVLAISSQRSGIYPSLKRLISSHHGRDLPQVPIRLAERS